MTPPHPVDALRAAAAAAPAAVDVAGGLVDAAAVTTSTSSPAAAVQGAVQGAVVERRRFHAIRRVWDMLHQPTSKKPAEFRGRRLARIINQSLDGRVAREGRWIPILGNAHAADVGPSISLAVDHIMSQRGGAETPIGHVYGSIGEYVWLTWDKPPAPDDSGAAAPAAPPAPPPPPPPPPPPTGGALASSARDMRLVGIESSTGKTRFALPLDEAVEVPSSTRSSRSSSARSSRSSSRTSSSRSSPRRRRRAR